MHQIIDGGVTAPLGFYATGKHIGLKKVKKDLSLLMSEVPAEAAGVFTQNIVKAAPVLWNKKLVSKGAKVRGIVTISGNANACTGERGVRDNEEMAQTYADCLGVDKEEILTAATGIIGLKMNMPLINEGIKGAWPALSRSREEAKNAAAGIITTDTFLKEIALKLKIAGRTVKIGAMAKGSGMIHPNMATVLAFITTDIHISQRLLQKALSYSVMNTYNMISVDGATSTNDMALIMANGMAQNGEIEEDSEFYEDFREALLYINQKLAMDVVHDGEGSGKFIEVKVKGARHEKDARLLAKSVVTNNLVKTAMFGEDANWGRIVAAMGSSGAIFDPSGVYISFESENGRISLMERGEPVLFDENMAAQILRKRDIAVHIALKDGDGEATAWGCDLGHEYVRINGEYRSRT